MSGALLGLLCLGLGAAIWLTAVGGWSERTQKALTMVGILAAPLLLIGALAIAWTGGRTGDLRLTLRQVTAEVRQYPLTIGGDAQADDIVVSRLPAGAVSVAPDPSRDDFGAPLVLQIAGTDAAPARAVVAIREGRRLRYPTAQPFAPGDAICVVAPCEAEGAAWAILRDRTLAPAVWRDGVVIAAEGAAGAPMPGRRTLLAFTGVNEWTPAQAIHPLRDYFPHAAWTAADGVMGDCDRWLCAGRGAAREPVRSVLFQKGGFRGSDWFVVLADPGARIAHADGGALRSAPYAPTAPIALTRPATIELMEPRFIDAPPDLAEARRGMLQPRRTLTIAEVAGQAQATFATPSLEVVGRCGDARPEGAASPRTTALGGYASQAVDRALPLPEGKACSGFNHASFQLPAGDAPSLRSVRFELDRLAAPWPVALMAALWAAAVLIGCRGLFASRPALWCLVSVLQLLLALRVLIGFAAAAADPSLDWRAIAAEAGVAYVLVPAILLTGAQGGAPRAPGEGLLTLTPLLAVAAMALWSHHLSFLSVLLLGAWAVMALHRLLATPDQDREASPLLERLRRGERRLLGRFKSTDTRRAAPWGAGLLVLVLIARLATGAAGWKERIDLGVTVLAISVVYTPLLLIGFSRLLASAQGAPASLVRPAVFYGLLILATFVVPFSVKDSGYAMMFAPIAGMAAWCAWTQRRRLAAPLPVAALWAAPAVAVLIALIALPVAGAVNAANTERLRLTPQMQQGLDDEAALQVLESQARTSQNLLRLYLLGAPEALGDAGSAEAESLKVWSAQLSDYAGSLLGRGYLTSPNLSALRSVQATDNLTAVHLMSPFGRLATGLLLGLLALAPIACAAMTRANLPKDDRPSDWRRICGFMALWCVFGAALYMTLANLQLVPFTGRNAYLLAATSGGDLLEGGILFFLAAWGVCATPAAAPAKPRRRR